MQAPPGQIGVHNLGIAGVGHGALDRAQSPTRIVLRSGGRLLDRAAVAEDLVDFVTGGFEIPAVFLPDQDHADAGAAARAIVRPRPVLIVEAVAIFAATQRAW